MAKVEDIIAGEPTIEKLESAYEHGYAAIINDGKLMGFTKEKPSDTGISESHNFLTRG
jgi:hypothetical protein